MKRELTLAVSAALLVASGTVSALTDTETNASIPFNLANPGARSMGMGGAFVGLADDATAAYSNPAGLTQLVAPEISAEGRHTDYSLPYVNGGSATVSPFNGSGLHTSDADSSKNNVSFLSFVYPHERWSFAFYRDELVRFGNDFGPTSSSGESITNTAITFPRLADADLKIVNYGVAAAFRAGDSVSLGLGLSYYDFDIRTLVQRLNCTDCYTNIATSTVLNEQRQFGSDNDVGVNLGARFVLSEHFSAGLTYRRGPKFSYEATSVGFENCDNSARTCVPVQNPTASVDLKNVRFKVPDVFGAGLSWHPNEQWVVNFDVDYIQYSQLTHGMQSLFGNDPVTVSKLSIPNGAEVHLGGEYTFTQFAHPFSIRAGVWHDPRHSIEFKGDPGMDGDVAALAKLFHGGQGSQTHGALGFGWAFAKFEIDGAADFSTVADTYSLSGIYRF
jgi:long-chain fatty acid transport protein